MITYENLISGLKEFNKIKVVGAIEQGIELALISLLEDNKEYKELWESVPDVGTFHKLLRQVGTDNQSGVDDAVWNLIHSSQIFWDVCSGENPYDF